MSQLGNVIEQARPLAAEYGFALDRNEVCFFVGKTFKGLGPDGASASRLRWCQVMITCRSEDDWDRLPGTDEEVMVGLYSDEAEVIEILPAGNLRMALIYGSERARAWVQGRYR